jgi:bacterioferritin-associated ferredoxin
MLVCQCNIISDREIKRVIRDLLVEDPWQIMVPAKVYRALAKRCKCSGCVPNVVDLIQQVTAEYHLEIAEAPEAVPADRTVTLPPGRKLLGAPDEGRTAGRRAS